MAPYVEPDPHPSRDGDDIPPGPKRLSSRAAALHLVPYCDTWGRRWDYHPDMLLAHAEAAQQGGTTETSEWAIKDMLAGPGGKQNFCTGRKRKSGVGDRGKGKGIDLLPIATGVNFPTFVILFAPLSS